MGHLESKSNSVLLKKKRQKQFSSARGARHVAHVFSGEKEKKNKELNAPHAPELVIVCHIGP
jgi:hypothetical protein